MLKVLQNVYNIYNVKKLWLMNFNNVIVGTQKIKAQAHLEQWYLVPQIKPKQ